MVFKGLHQIINKQLYTEKNLIQFNDKWISLNHHGNFTSSEKDDCLNKINSSILEAHQQLQKTKTIFITLGSAWVYEYLNFGIVANCHKIPNKEFSKRLLNIDRSEEHTSELQSH